jgi:hypothetical protein
MEPGGHLRRLRDTEVAVAAIDLLDRINQHEQHNSATDATRRTAFPTNEWIDEPPAPFAERVDLAPAPLAGLKMALVRET